jgi:hypothetical protein
MGGAWICLMRGHGIIAAGSGGGSGGVPEYGDGAAGRTGQ